MSFISYHLKRQIASNVWEKFHPDTLKPEIDRDFRSSSSFFANVAKK